MNHIDGMISDEEFDKICKAFPEIEWLRHHFVVNSGAALRIEKRPHLYSASYRWYFHHNFIGNKIEIEDTDLNFIIQYVKIQSGMLIEELDEVKAEFSKLK